MKNTNTVAQIPMAKVPWSENVSYQLREKNGKIKKIFKLNFLGKFLMKKFGQNKFMFWLKDSKGKDLKCFHLLKIPFLFGFNVNSMSIANLVTSAGKAGLASRINGDGAVPPFLYIGLGTGTTAPIAGNTTLEAEITTNGGGRALGAASRVETNVVNDTARVSKTFAFTGSLAITESAIFSAISGGVMAARQVFAVMNVESGNELVIIWDLSNA